jgi:hypothetical protein
MSKEIVLAPGGGFFYRAMAFHWLIVVVAILPALVMITMAILNPFWFRNSFFEWVERIINRFSLWRNYQKYKIYLGCDPKVWHGLKD